MKITKEIFWFTSDDHGGMVTRLFLSQDAMWAAMREVVRATGWTELAEEMDKVAADDDWSELWEQFTEEQQYDQNYFNHGSDTIEIEIPHAS